jgi:hypothetical protein
MGEPPPLEVRHSNDAARRLYGGFGFVVAGSGARITPIRSRTRWCSAGTSRFPAGLENARARAGDRLKRQGPCGTLLSVYTPDDMQPRIHFIIVSKHTIASKPPVTQGGGA